jgi:cytochrome c-type biogenesis protein CcmH/NrfF
LLLWGLPPLALIAGMVGLVAALRRRRTATEPAPLSAAEQRRLATLVEPGTE